MKKIKILRIIARLNIGGPAIHTILLTESLDKSRFETLLICGSISKDEGNMFYYAKQKGIELTAIPELKREINIFNDLVALWKIYKIIKIEQPDIIHTHTAKAGTLGRLAAIIYNCARAKDKHIKIIHTFHGHIFQGYFDKFKTKLFIVIERFLARYTSKIITVSGTLKKELISFAILDENKIEVIPLGLELNKLLDIQPKDDIFLNIGIIGRLVPIKNHHLFLDAAVEVIQANPKISLRFKVIGDGKLRKDLENYSHKLNINQQVDFLGWQKDLVCIYSSLDIVALTSLNEGTPLSLIEAMASAKPIVATDVGGISDLLGKEIIIKPNTNFKILERGILVKSGDTNSFSAAINFIIENTDLRKKMGLESRNFVRNKFTKERLLKDMENLYLSLMPV